MKTAKSLMSPRIFGKESHWTTSKTRLTKSDYLDGEVTCTLESFEHDANAIGDDGQQGGHKEHVRVPFRLETVLSGQSPIPDLLVIWVR